MVAVDPRRFVLLGPPASGKGTQGRRLAASLGLGYLSTGALLREEVEAGTPLGEEASPILARGGYLPDELMNSIIGAWLEKQATGWVLDGFPRSIAQAEFLRGNLPAGHGALEAAIALDVPFSTLLERIKTRRECPECRWSGPVSLLAAGRCPECGLPALPRPDDDEANFRNRFQEYTVHTSPVVAWYEEQGLLISCDATDEPEAVSRRLLTRIAEGRTAPRSTVFSDTQSPSENGAV